ncbi:MAG: ElyC/SanA/YdcF family protein, partial [Chloroflexota bacterium]
IIFGLPRLYTNLRYQGSIHWEQVAPTAPVAIVFGAGLLRDGSPTLILRDRVETAAQLYWTGKAKTILLSGDNRFVNYNEPKAMRDYALSLGLPESALVLDYAGRRTYDTCLRAKEIFGVSKALLVTQHYHLDRALLTCDTLGLDVQGVAADRSPYPRRPFVLWWLREIPATTQAFWDLYVSPPTDVVLGKKEKMVTIPSRDFGWQLVTEHVKDVGLRRHMLAVEAAMRWYARPLGQDEELWGCVGLIHDFDWEIHPDLDRHPIEGSKILRARGVDEEIIRTILSHYTEGTGIEREKPIDFALLACDEITGLIIATALVRPSKNIADVEVSSVKKKWRTPAFAAGVHRDQAEAATADFSRACFDGKLDLWTHAGNVLAAMQGAAAELDLDGRLATAQTDNGQP